MTCPYMQTHFHTCAHACTHPCAHTNTPALTDAHTTPNAHTCIHNPHTHTHTQTRTSAHPAPEVSLPSSPAWNPPFPEEHVRPPPHRLLPPPAACRRRAARGEWAPGDSSGASIPGWSIPSRSPRQGHRGVSSAPPWGHRDPPTGQLSLEKPAPYHRDQPGQKEGRL